MALVFKLESQTEKILADLDKVGEKARKVYGSVAKEGKKAMKIFDMQTSSLIMAGAAAAAAFWGIAQVSPLVSTMLTQMGAGFGAIFNVIFSSLMPVFIPFLGLLFKFAGWLQEQPYWLKLFLAVLILIPPVIIAIAGAVKLWNFISILRGKITKKNLLLLKAKIGALYMKLKATILATAATVKATIATRALNFALMASPWALIAIAVMGIGLGVSNWAGSSKKLSPSLESNVGLTEEWNMELSELQRQLATVQAEMGDYSSAVELISSDLVGASGVFIGEVEAMILATPDLPAAAVAEIENNLIPKIESNASEIETILAGAYGRDLTNEEILAINGFADENEDAMERVNTILTGAGDGSLPKTLTDAFTDVVTFGSSFDTVGDKITGEGGLTEQIIDLNEAIVSIDTSSAETGFDDAAESTNVWITALGGAATALTDLGQLIAGSDEFGPGYDLMYGSYDQATGANRPWWQGGGNWNPINWDNPFNDVILQPGREPVVVNPQDTIMSFKDPDKVLGNGGTGTIVNVDIHDVTVRSKEDIDYLVDEISRRLREEAGRYI